VKGELILFSLVIVLGVTIAIAWAAGTSPTWAGVALLYLMVVLQAIHSVAQQAVIDLWKGPTRG
jgi:hypothetical protein